MRFFRGGPPSPECKPLACSASGFSLIEIALVLVIIALVAAAGLGTVSTVQENASRAETAKSLEEIREVLLTYATSYGRLPCPADPVAGTGEEDKVGGKDDAVCNREVGVLPWVLEISETDPPLRLRSQDGWGRWFTYHVSADRTASPPLDWSDGKTASLVTIGCSATPSVSATIALCSPATLVVTNVSNGAAAVVISHGRLGEGAFGPSGRVAPSASPDEVQNTDDLKDDGTQAAILSRVYVSRDFSAIAGAEFDDQVLVINPFLIKSRMVENGVLP